MATTDISIRGLGPPDGKLCVIEVRGVLDAESADDLERALTTIVEKGLWRVIVDLSGVNYISSAGWGIFTGQIKEVRSRGGDIKLAAMQPGVREVFELLELDYFIQSFDTVEEAQERFLRRLGISVSQPLESTVQEEEVAEPPPEKETQPERRIPPLPEKPVQISEESPKPLEIKPPSMRGKPTLEERVEEILRENPNYGVWKIKKLLKSPKYGHIKVKLRHLHILVKSLRQELSEEAVSPPPERKPSPPQIKPAEGEAVVEWAKLKEERERLEREKRLIQQERERLQGEWEKVKRERIALIKARREAGSGGSRRIPSYFNEIVKVVRKHPQFGPKAIQQELNTSPYGFIALSSSTVYRRLRRGGLNTKEKRIRFASLNSEQPSTINDQ